MQNTARYYLGRVHKAGQLDQEKLIGAIVSAVSVERRNFNFTFTDAKVFGNKEEPNFIFSRLAKYKPRGAVDIVRPEEHKEATADIENLIDASSPFVFIPRFYGIAYQHISGRLEKDVFERIFPELISKKYDNFFVSCGIEPITDLRTFVARLSKLEQVRRLQATVKPPNPLFGPCWASLKDYLKSRNLEEVSVKEEAQPKGGINTNIQKIAEIMIQGKGRIEEVKQLLEPYMQGIGDAAVLMAADGYGKAKIEGVEDEKTVIIHTRENQKSFVFGKEPTPDELYERAFAELQAINKERYLDH